MKHQPTTNTPNEPVISVIGSKMAAYQSGRAGRPNRRAYDERNRLRYAFDAGFLSRAHCPTGDVPRAPDLAHDDEDSNSNSNSPPGPGSESDADSDGESTSRSDVAASLRVVSDSLLKTERAESEMAKAREALRLEAEKRRAESEAELTQMVMRTQLQIASLCSRPVPSRKRKRADQEDERTSAVASQRYVPTATQGGGCVCVLQILCESMYVRLTDWDRLFSH